MCDILREGEKFEKYLQLEFCSWSRLLEAAALNTLCCEAAVGTRRHCGGQQPLRLPPRRAAPLRTAPCGFIRDSHRSPAGQWQRGGFLQLPPLLPAFSPCLRTECLPCKRRTARARLCVVGEGVPASSMPQGERCISALLNW